MEMKPSDLLHLRVYAIQTRLKEVSSDVSETRGEMYELRQQIEEKAVSSLMEDSGPAEDLNGLKERLDEREAHAERQEKEEIRLKGVLLNARRDHLRQLKQEKPNRWIILE